MYVQPPFDGRSKPSLAADKTISAIGKNRFVTWLNLRLGTGMDATNFFLGTGYTVAIQARGGEAVTVYLDLAVILNFLVDFLLLMGTNRLSGFPAGTRRCALAAALGGIYSGVSLLPGFHFLGNLLWRGVCLGIMSVIAFGMNRSAVKRGGVFVLLSMALGGMALSLGKTSFLPLVLCGCMLLILCRWAFGGKIGGREYVPLNITYGENSVSLIALRDSGNSLRDPISGEPVFLISADAAQNLTGLSEKQLRTPLETLTRQPIPGLRLIPYRAVGNGNGMLLGLRFENIKVGDISQSAIIAFVPEGLGRGAGYQALVTVDA